MVALRRRAFFIGAASATAALTHAGLEHWPRASANALRVCSWNLCNFPRQHDRRRIREVLAHIGPDVVLLQEILDPSALSEVLPGFAVRSSTGGGRSDQKVAVAVRSAAGCITGAPREFDALSMGGRVRPGFALPLRVRGRGLTALCVHLKATPRGIETRREQWEVLREIVREMSGPLIVGGDFNCTGRADGSARAEIDSLDRTLEPVGLRRLTNPSGCTAAWGGVRYDAWQEPSLLDLLWIKGWGTSTPLPQVDPRTHCRRHGCRAFRSSDAYPDFDLERASDHCPIVANLPPAPL